MSKWILQIHLNGRFRDIEETIREERHKLFDIKRKLELDTGYRYRVIERRVKEKTI